MDDHVPQALPSSPPDENLGTLIELNADSREAGRAAGFAWAAEEARRGYLHPMDEMPYAKGRIVIEHALQAFGGLIHGRPRAFIRGFVQGVSDFWRSHSSE
jgi:hypothetical protein